MSTQYEPDLMTETTPPPPPLWVWLLVVGLGVVALYSGYTALQKHQLYMEGETIRQELAQQRDRLQADVADLKQQVEQANRSKEEVENALKQSRANTDSASGQISDLQAKVGDLQQKAGTFETAAKAAEERANAASAAKDAADKELATLKAQLADAQKKLKASQAELAKEREQVSPVPVGPPPAAAPAN
jgi:chromosome segregation ATPase